jgi:hypothetical protein
MKPIRNLMILGGLCLMLFAMGVTGASAQAISTPSFSGTFTLPEETHWGKMILPAGDYSLSYGTRSSSTYLVTVDGKAAGSPRGMLFAWPRNEAKTAENVLNCIREDDILYVRSLEMAELGQSISFPRPHGVSVSAWIEAGNKSHNVKTQLTETRRPIAPVN